MQYQIPKIVDVFLVPIFWSMVPHMTEPAIPMTAAMVTVFKAVWSSHPLVSMKKPTSCDMMPTVAIPKKP